MDFETIIFQKEGRIGIVTLNRPRSFNSINQKLMEEVSQVFDLIHTDDEVGVVILTGQAKYFGAGADIKEFTRVTTSLQAMDFVQAAQATYYKIDHLGKPVIAAVGGLALGGGCEMALACDLIIAADNARFGLPEIKLGLIPGAGGTQRLPRLVGHVKAKEMIFTGEPIDAQEAWRIGLVNKVVPLDSLMDEAKKLASILLDRPAPALRMAKTAVNEGFNLDLPAALAYEARCFALLFSTEDQKEGLAAFVEKRKADFKGR